MGLDEQLFNLKFQAKALAREARKCEKEEVKEKAKLKKAIEKSNADGARIYAGNAIRQKNQALNFLRLSSRIDAVAARLQSAIRMNQVTKDMGKIVSAMESSLSSMNIEKVSLTMEAFERQFENLDVQADFVESAMAGSVASSTPADEVENLIAQVAEENALNVQFMMPGAASKVAMPSTAAAQQQPAAAAAGDDFDALSARFDRLKK